MEPIRVTPAVRKKLDQRRELTSGSRRLVIVLVGLPGRGKSFLGRKLQSYLSWRGSTCRVFNVGLYRRAAVGGDAERACDADFFDANNEAAARVRHEVAMAALRDLTDWLDAPEKGSPARDRVAIFDATNSTKARRRAILERVTAPGRPATGVVFVESVCDDEDLLEENFRQKIRVSPDYADADPEVAAADLRARVRHYERQYETIDDDSLSYIKVFNLSSKLLANQIYGRMSKIVVPALMAWNLGTRPVWICRAGATSGSSAASSDDDDDGRRARAGSLLGAAGERFRDDLRAFAERGARRWLEARDELDARAYAGPALETGTSVDGEVDGREAPLRVLSSTMPRATRTVSWAEDGMQVRSNLNPLDKGDFAGMELEAIRRKDPDWYARLERDPYNTRFPGGECYRDLVARLESVVIDVEQQVAPVLVVGHVSVIQALLAYFRGTPVEQCASIAVPLHTVVQLTPVMGGGWAETQTRLRGPIDHDHDTPSPKRRRARRPTTNTTTTDAKPSIPIWGDHVAAMSDCDDENLDAN